MQTNPQLNYTEKEHARLDAAHLKLRYYVGYSFTSAFYFFTLRI